jgi:glycine/serine hydroxymethyltransferase
MLELDLEEGIGLVDNPHLNRIAALGLALEEMREDTGYGARVVENARAIAGALHGRGVPLRFRERGFTASHQVLFGLSAAGAEKLCRDLEEVSVFIDAWGRLGTAEATHRGMGPEEMKALADCIATVYHGQPHGDIAQTVRELAAAFEMP